MLARAWKVTVAGDTGLAVALYRRMLTEGVLAEMLDGLVEADRMIFRRLAASSRITSQNDLLRSLPFAEERLAASLAILQDLGLAWLGLASGREGGGRAWFVPNDLVRALNFVRRPNSPASGRVEVPQTQPALHILDRPIIANVPSDVVVDLIDALSAPIGGRRQTVPDAHLAIRDFARRLGVGLGVWEKATRGVRPGPRYSRWQEASDWERRRAVARLWLVEPGARQTDGPLRRAAWDAMRDAETERWYDFNSVARVLASKLGSLAAGGNGPTSASQADPNRALTRSKVEQVLLELTWLSVLEAGINPVGRVVAIRITPVGKRVTEES